MAKLIIKDVGIMKRQEVRYDLREPGELNAMEKALSSWAETLPVAMPDDLPGEALDRENAKQCKAILATVDLADMMDKKESVDIGLLRDRGQNEDSGPYIAAHWLGAYNGMMAQRQKLLAGDMCSSTIGGMLVHAQEMGRIQERLSWRAGVEKIYPGSKETWVTRETLALSGRRQKKGGHDGNKMKCQKSFSTLYGVEAQAMAEALHREKPSRTWAFIRDKIAQEYSVSAETVKKALKNPKKK